MKKLLVLIFLLFIITPASSFVNTNSTTTIATDSITQTQLNDTNNPTDEQCLTYEVTGDIFEWQNCINGTVTKTYGPFTADSMTIEGNCVLTTNTAIVSGGLVVPYISCADITGDQFWFGPIMMPDGWDAGTVIFKISGININASPSGTDTLSISGICFGDSDQFPTSIPITGQQTASIIWATQNANEIAITAPITLNGTPSAGDLCMFLFDVTAAGAQIADVRWHTFWMEYTWNRTGD